MDHFAVGDRTNLSVDWDGSRVCELTMTSIDICRLWPEYGDYRCQLDHGIEGEDYGEKCSHSHLRAVS